MEYYAMVTPGRAGDWGNVILIDARVGTFVQEAFKLRELKDLKKLKKKYTAEQWAWLRKELRTEDMDDDTSDEGFIAEQKHKWDTNLSDSYYDFSELESTYCFGSISSIFDFVAEYGDKVIGDLG